MESEKSPVNIVMPLCHCGGQYCEASVAVNIVRPVWRSILWGQCGGQYCEASVAVNIVRPVCRSILWGQCGGQYCEASVAVDSFKLNY